MELGKRTGGGVEAKVVVYIKIAVPVVGKCGCGEVRLWGRLGSGGIRIACLGGFEDSAVGHGRAVTIG